MAKTKRKKPSKGKQIFRIVLLAGTFISLWFVPWILVKAWIMPLPDTVEEQVEQTLSYGFDGVIVYVDEAGKPPAFYTAGYHNKAQKYQRNLMPYSKSQVSANYMLPLPLPNWLVTTV